MRNNEFKNAYNYALKTNIVTDDWFCTAGYFWIQLTYNQHRKMYNLMLMQGAKEDVNKKGIKYIQLSNGIQVLKL